MENEDKVEPDYLKGFNEGYMISQHLPELADQLAGIDSDSIRLTGFKAGRDQYQTEQIKDRLPSWLKGDRTAKDEVAQTKHKGRDVEPDKD